MKTQKAIVFVTMILFSLIAFRAAAAHSIQGGHEPLKTSTTADNDYSMPMKMAPLPESKGGHGKPVAPQFEELPHIHKFHKDRVKRLKKHHGKCWFISRLILAICHISILLIAYLHLIH